MSKKSKKADQKERDPVVKPIIKQYIHIDKKRAYNPPVGLVTPSTDEYTIRNSYSNDPYIDPYLHWSYKKQHSELDIDLVSLHVHERIDPLTIIEKLLKKDEQKTLLHYFEDPLNTLPLRDAIEFYKHPQNWSNRLIAGDSLLIMNSLLQKESMAEKVQMIYIDPPYGIKYSSNFQPFVNKTEVKDGKDEDLTREPEMVKAFRDTWELGIHSYLNYLRDRLLLAKILINETGSIFVQINDENVHHVRELLGEIFGEQNYVAQIQYRTSGSLSSSYLKRICDYVLWYAKDKSKLKFNRLFVKRSFGENSGYSWVQLPNGVNKKISELKESNQPIPKGSTIFTTENMVSSGYTQSCIFPFEFEGRRFFPSSGKSWKTTREGMETLAAKGRLIASGETLRYIMFYKDYPVMSLTNMWDDMAGAKDKVFIVQTNPKVIQRCMLMTTDPGDIVFDPTCGSGTTALVAESWGRRWITCDTSRIALAIAKQRLVASTFKYYTLKNPTEGISSGFKYQTVPHVTMGSIANNSPPLTELLYDSPEIDSSKIRISGPFTVEGVPSPMVKSIDELGANIKTVDTSIGRTGRTVRQDEWMQEILHTGVRGRTAQKIEFLRVEPLSGTRWLHCDADTKEDVSKRVVISFGPEYSPLDQNQVALAIEESQNLIPKPKMIIFAAFQFDPEASKDIEGLKWPGMTILKAQMNPDLLVTDLKKKRSANESFWLIGQPDIEIINQTDGKFVVKIHGFDYYNSITGEIESGNTSKITMWMLDTDYDGRSLYPKQIFFPLEGSSNSWSKISRSLNILIDEEKIEKFKGTESVPFSKGQYSRVAIKIIDDRGIESLRIQELEH